MAEARVAELYFPCGTYFIVVAGDLLNTRVDCIVNAANGGLSHGGGVAAAIAEAAGPKLEDECERIIREHGRIAVTHSVITTAGELPYKGVIHVVGPRMGDGDEERKLTRTLQLAFVQAHKRGWSSLAFPAVSSGIFAVPYEACARAYLKAVTGYFELYPETCLRTIRLCVFEGPLLDAVVAELTAYQKNEKNR
ncbi:MAG: macro domain-containing protein [Betaproteobacteria bacterium]|nr:macro domain-containing protein [Betaproteobacteria bacterium]